MSVLLGVALASVAHAQAPLRKIGELELQLAGVQALLDPPNPVVPKATPAGVRIVVRSGGRELTAEEVRLFVGGEFLLQAELSGPGLPQTITLPQLDDGEALQADPLILPLPGLAVGGDYELSNVRLVSGGRAVLGVTPETTTLKVIDQVLVTRLVTRALTLDELRARGIEVTDKDHTGFQFSLGLRLESQVVTLDFPVVFDRKGVVVPQPIVNVPSDPTRTVEAPSVPRPPATIVPVLLLPEEPSGGPGGAVGLTLPSGEPLTIPSVLVIPGNVGYLKQFFSALVYVANGAPAGSRLFVKDVAGTIRLPAGDDRNPGSADDPLHLAKRTGEDQPAATLNVLGPGPDEAPGTADDVARFGPGEQGQAEWVLVGDKEGFHPLDIDLGATLEGLPTGPVRVKGSASGGVLVRNAFFDVTFAVPSVVREGETFRAAVTLTNVGKGDGQDVRLFLDAARTSGLKLLSPSQQQVNRIPAGEAHAFEYEFQSLRTGKVVATYLRFDAQAGVNVTGKVAFTIGVTDEGVPLSPDTLVLPASTSLLPAPVVQAAMRVLGQAWTVANAPRGTLPARVTPITRGVVEQKALALAEAGLRITLREQAERAAATREALRDLVLDLWGGDAIDPGFDRLLREGNAGHALALALGEALAEAADAAGGPDALERELAGVAVSGRDSLSFSVSGPVDLTLTDAEGRRSVLRRSGSGPLELAIPGSALLPLGPIESAPVLGFVADAASAGYRLDVSGPAALSLTAPQGAAFARGTAQTSARARLSVDVARPEPWVLREDLDGDGEFETVRDVATETIESPGPQLVAAAIIGPETLPRASGFGTNAVLVFDRPVGLESAGEPAAYEIPRNAVAFAKPQLSGRLVFATLERPEGPYVEAALRASGIADLRGVEGGGAVPLRALLAEPGAVVSGRVLEADGRPVEAGSVVYGNAAGPICPGQSDLAPLARVPLGEDGSYEIRYVRQTACGFRVAAADERKVLLRQLLGRVRRGGERILLDIVLIGEGAVEGVVRDLAGAAVAGAAVVARSETDPGRGGSAVSDSAGRYRVESLPVGLVTVRAAKGAALGSATGRIERAGTAASVDLVLDAGAVRVSGYFWQVRDGVQKPVEGAVVSYTAGKQAAGFAFTDATGAYALDGMPVGDFTLEASGNGPYERASASVKGTARAGDRLEHVDLMHVAKPEAVLGTARGLVVLPDGTPAAGAIVARDVSTWFIENATVTDAQGRFEVPGLPVGVDVSIGAITQDRRRQGHVFAHVDPQAREQDGLRIELSGLGTAEFTVVGANGAAVANQEVRLLGVGVLLGLCRDPCGCRSATTDSAGRVRFEGLGTGAVSAVAIRNEAGFVEAAGATAVIQRDGATASDVIRLKGAGTVRGTLKPPPGVAMTGGDVRLTSLTFVNDGLFTCGMVKQESHRGAVRIDDGSYELRNVALGPVVVVGRHPFTSATASAGGTLTRAGEVLQLDLQLADTTAGELAGRVLLPSGTPAGAGVEVTADGPLPDVTVLTDAAGRFAFARVLPAGSYSLTARDPVTGFVVRDRVQLAAGQPLEHDLRLLGRGTVRVRVVTASDEPVDRAVVTLVESHYPQRTHRRTIEPALQGVATFEGVFEGPFSLEAKDMNGRGGRGSGAVPSADATVQATVRLGPAGTVRGRFLMPSREPIPYALVTLAVNGSTVGQTTTAGSGDVGSFSFDFVPAGPVRVSAQDPLTLRTGLAVGTLETDGATLELEVTAQGLGRVEGTVRARDAGGEAQPQPGAQVRLAADGYEGSTLADAAGHYAFDGVPEGPASVTASIGERALRGTSTGTLLGDGARLTLDVLLRDSGRLSGRVLRHDGQPAPPSTLRIAPSGGGVLTTYTREGGAFALERVPAGIATVTAEEIGGIDRGRATVDVTLAGADVSVTLNGTGALSGRALDAEGLPVAGLLTIEGSGAFPWAQRVQVPAGGSFRFPEVLAGPVTLSLQAKPGELTLYGTATSQVTAGGEETIDVRLQPSGTVSGRVLRSDGTTPAHGAWVTLQLDSGRGQVAVQADGAGAFLARGVPLGGFDLRASDPLSGGLAALRQLSLQANGQQLVVPDVVLDATAPLVTILEPAEGSTRAMFAGTLVVDLADEGAGLDLSTLVVSYPLASAAGPGALSFAGSRGTALLGPQQLVGGCNTIRVSVKDLAGRVGEASVTFRVLGGTIRGSVRLAGGAPVAGATVEVHGRRTTSGADGGFVLTGLAPQTWWVTATHPVSGLKVSTAVALADGGEQSVALELPAFAWLAGVVLDSSGAGVPGALIYAVDGPFVRQASSGADGAFSLGAVPLGTYRIDAQRAGRLRGRIEALALATPGATESAEIRLVPTATVSGMVIGAGGPVAGARVSLRSLADPWGGILPQVTSATAGAAGAYAVEDVPPGPFVVTAVLGGDQADAQGTVPPEGGVLTLDLQMKASAVQVPATLGDALGISWMVQTSGALVTSGTRRVFPPEGTTPRLTIETAGFAETFPGAGCPPVGACMVRSEDGQRELVFSREVAGLSVTRKLYVPRDGYFVRVLDLVRNAGAAPVRFNLREESDLYSTSARLSSSGDAAAQPQDRWLVLDDSDSSDIFSIAHHTNSFAPTALVAWGEGGRAPAQLSLANVSSTRTRVTQAWNDLDVAPGQTVGILRFVSIQSDRARARASGERLVQLPPEALAGLDAHEASAIVNFVVPGDLSSTLQSLPPLDGVVEGVALGGDHATVVPSGAGLSASLRSRSPHFGTPITMAWSAAGVLSASGEQGRPVPRTDFDVTVRSASALGTVAGTAAGQFAFDGGGPAARASVRVAFEGTGTIDGVVRRSDGSGVGGGIVRLERSGSSITTRATTAGAFRFVPVPGGSYRLTADHPLGSHSASTEWFGVPGACATSADGLVCARTSKDVVFGAFGSLAGTVRDATGAGVSASLELLADGFRRVLMSSAAGEHQFDDVPPGTYTVVARRQGAIASAVVAIVADQLAVRDLVLEGPSRLQGILRGGGDAPIAFGAVHLLGTSGGQLGVGYSDGNGAFAIEGLGRSPAILRGYSTGSVDGTYSHARVDVPVSIDAGVVSADAWVSQGVLEPGETQLWALTAAEGRTLYLLGAARDVAAAGLLASHRLEVFGPDGLSAHAVPSGSSGSRASQLYVNAQQAGEHVIAVRSTSALRGGYWLSSPLQDDVHLFRPYRGGLVAVSVSRAGVPLPGTAVRVDSGALVREARAGEDARVEVAIAAGEVVARVSDPSTGLAHEARGTLPAGGTLSLEIVLPAMAGSVAGTVTNGDGLTPLPGARVTLEGVGETTTGAGGSYAFDGVPPGTRRLEVAFAGAEAERTVVCVGEPVVADLQLPLPVVRGYVRDRLVQNVPGALVEGCAPAVSGVAACRTTTSNADGHYVFYGYDAWTPGSELHLRAAFPGGSKVEARVQALLPVGYTGTVWAVLEARATARLSGRVVSAGLPLAGASVVVYAAGSDWLLAEGTTNANGEYAFDELPPAGQVRVHAQDADGIPGQGLGELSEGVVERVDVAIADVGRLEVGIADGAGRLRVQAIEQPAAAGGPWTRTVDVPGVQPVALRVPVGAYRVVIEDVDPTGAVEGVLAAGDTRTVVARAGTHVRLPYPLRADEATFAGDVSCPPPCATYVPVHVRGAESYPAVAALDADGRGLRSLLVARAGVRVRRLQHLPESGAFLRTLTLVSNPGTEPVEALLDTSFVPGHEQVTAGGGNLDASDPWVAWQSGNGAQGLVIGSALAPESFVVGEVGDVHLTHRLALAPGETRGFLTFTLSRVGVAPDALASIAESLAALAEPGALAGLTNDERAAIVNFTVPPAGDVAVVVSHGGSVAGGATVVLSDAQGEVVRRGRTGADGAVALTAVKPGSYRVVAVGAEGRPGRVDVLVAEGATADAPIALLADTQLGRVRVAARFEEPDAPAEEAVIALESTEWPGWSALAPADEDGAVEFARVPPGLVRVSGAVGEGSTAPVTAGGTASLQLVLLPYVGVTGTATAGDGASPLPGATVELRDPRTLETLASAKTDAEGRYRLVLEGEVPEALDAVARFDDVEATVTLPAYGPGELVPPPFAVPVGVVTGRVTLWGTPVRHPFVTSGRLRAESAADGTFRLLGVSPGLVEMTVIDPASGFAVGATVIVDPSVPSLVEIEVGPPGS